MIKNLLQSTLLKLKTIFIHNYRFFFLSLLIACISCPAYDMIYAPGIDGSLFWVFNYFADGNFLSGKNILFPHGPLAFLLYPLPMGNNYFVALTVHILCASLLAMSLYKIHSLKGHAHYALITGILLLLLSFLDIQLLLIALAASLVVLFRLTGNKFYLAGCVLFSVFNLYIKSYGGVICGLIVAGELAHLIFVRKNFSLALQSTASFFLLFFLVWLCLFGSMDGSLSFLRGQYELSTNNSEAVQYSQENNWWLLGLSLVSLLSIYFVCRDALSRSFFLLMLLPLFAAWKHAMGRGEEFHIRGFLHMLMLFVFILWIITEEKKIMAVIFGLVSLSAFTLNLALMEDYYAKQKNIGLFKVYNLYRALGDYDSLAAEKNGASKYYIRDQYLPDTIKKLIGKNTVDVYPWNYAIIAANGLNWAPRPVINSYACYTHWLDAQNSEHTKSENSARFVIWEFTDPDEKKGFGFEGIDYRYILNDEPQNLISFFTNYELKLKTGRYLVYEKLSSKLEPVYTTLSPYRPVEYDRWIDVPAFAENGITRARIEIGKTFTGALKSLLYKGEIFYIFYELENKKIYSHRIVPKNAADGLWLNPFILFPGSNGPEPPVKKIKIVCYNQKLVSPTFDLQFEQIRFKSGAVGVDLLGQCFKMNNNVPKKDLFFNLNKTETISDPSHFIENPDIKKTDKEYLSAPLWYVLEPGQHSGLFNIKPDSAMLTKDTRKIRFYFEGYVKTTKAGNALFVISRDSVVKEGNWHWTKKVKEILDEDNTWTHIYYVDELPVEQLNSFRNFYFYVWNINSRERLYLDDFSVTVLGYR